MGNQRKVTKWINNNFHSTSKDNDFNAIKDFLLLWSLFEDKVFHNNFIIDRAASLINEKNENDLNVPEFNKVYIYFKQRYCINNVILFEIFENLHFRGNDRKAFVKQTLLAPNPSIQDKVLTSMIIIYRFRNNLFHGLKDMTNIKSQKNNFIHANKFLMKFMELFR